MRGEFSQEYLKVLLCDALELSLYAMNLNQKRIHPNPQTDPESTINIL